MKTYHIRYNTKCTSNYDRWRLIEDGKEILVAKIYIDGFVYTSEYWVNVPTDKFPHGFPVKKWHISCKGECEIKNNVAYISCKQSKDNPLLRHKSKDNSLLRHTLKTISYRFLGTITTFTVSYVTTGSIVFASTIGFTELMIKPVLYFVHERIWYKFVKFKK
jgi:uncharacterized membrane protein